MEYDFVPLDEMITLKTAVNCFNEEFKKAEENYFNRKFQRLREIYFALFACKALNIVENKEHLLLFRKDQNYNDVSFISLNNNENRANIQYYDVKEYINNKDNINIFLKNVFKKTKYQDYNLIIGIHKDGKLKLDLSLIEKSLFLISSIDPINKFVYKAKVKLLSRKKILFDEILDLENLIDDNYVPKIFHNKLKFI